MVFADIMIFSSTTAVMNYIYQLLRKLEDKGGDLEHLYDMNEKEIGLFLRYPHGGKVSRFACIQVFVSNFLVNGFVLQLVTQCLSCFPRVHISANISPITRSVLQVSFVTGNVADIIFWSETSMCSPCQFL